MVPESTEPSSEPPANASAAESPNPAVSTQDTSTHDSPPLLSASGISSSAKNLKMPLPLAATQDDSQTEDAGKSTFSRYTSGFRLRLSPAAPTPAENVVSTSTTTQPGVLESFTKGLVDSSKNAVKAVQVKARHIVSQNKRRYQVAERCCCCWDFLFVLLYHLFNNELFLFFIIVSYTIKYNGEDTLDMPQLYLVPSLLSNAQIFM